MGPSGHFYSCMGLITCDTGFLRVDGLSTDPRDFGRHNFTRLHSSPLFLYKSILFRNWNHPIRSIEAPNMS